MDEIKKQISSTIDEYVAQCKDIKKEVVKYQKGVNKTFNKWRESEKAFCSNLREKNTTPQKSLIDLEVKFNEDSVFPINPVFFVSS